MDGLVEQEKDVRSRLEQLEQQLSAAEAMASEQLARKLSMMDQPNSAAAVKR